MSQPKHQQKISNSLSSQTEQSQKQYFNRSSATTQTLQELQNGASSSSSQHGKKNSKKMGNFRKWFSKFGGGNKSEEEKANKEISQKLKKHLSSEESTMSMLLLGAGGSGKSTVLKQMEQIHNGDMDEKQMAETINFVHKNITLDIYDLCKHYFVLKEKNDDISFESSDIENIAIKIATEHDPIHNHKLTASFANDIKILWNTHCMKKVFEIRKKSHIMDNTPWFMQRVEEYANASYIPTFADYVRIRDCTTGVIHSEFSVNHGNRHWLFKIIDVGGQRAERRKWLHVFSGIDVVIYVMSLSSYDQVLFEDHNTRCYDETLNLFEKTTANKIFDKTDFIVFLNKNDIFQEKIKQIPFTIYNKSFPQNDAKNHEKIIEWIKQQFTQRFLGENNNVNNMNNEENIKPKKKRGLHYHVTCATDTNQIETVIRYVQIELIRRLMSRAALL